MQPTSNQDREPSDTSHKPSSFYLAEIAHLRSDCVVRLRHAVRLVDREYSEIHREAVQQAEPASSTSEGSNKPTHMNRSEVFEAWWEKTQDVVQELENKVQHMAENVSEALREIEIDNTLSVVTGMATLEV